MFAYGTLLLPDIIGRLLGRVPPSVAAELPGYRRVTVKGEAFPAVFAAAGSRVSGRCYRGLTAQELARLDHYEGELYDRVAVQIEVAGALEVTDCYVIRHGCEAQLSEQAWELERFVALHAAGYRLD